MFPLAGTDFPTDSAQLAAGIRDALAEVLTLANKATAVTATGGAYPAVKQLRIDLDGATVSATNPPPKPKPVGKREPGITVDQFEISGHPVKYEQSKLDLDLKAKGVTLEFARDKGRRPLLVLAGAKEGHVEAKITKADIEAVVKSLAGTVAKQQGIALQDLDLSLTSDGDRSLAADVRVKAKKMVMSGVIHIKGRVDVDEDLNAIVSGLTCTGEGMIGTMASAVVQPKLKAYEGKKVALVAFSLGDVALRDLKISAKGNSVQVTADFGGKT